MTREQLDALGYVHARRIGERWCALQPFLFTVGLVVGIEEPGYSVRYCYERHADALDALLEWDGRGHPAGPWIKAKGAGVDLLNPELCA